MKVAIKNRKWRPALITSLAAGNFLPEAVPFRSGIANDDRLWKEADARPQKIVMPWGPSVWIYQGMEFSTKSCEGIDDADLELLILEAFEKDKRRFERPRARYGGAPK